MQDTDIRSFLAEHPKLMGALFTTVLLLSQAGTVVAHGTTHSGP